MTSAIILPTGDSESELEVNGEIVIVVSYVSVCSSRKESLYSTMILISCSPNAKIPSVSTGMLNGTGESGSISSMYCVASLMLESPRGCNVTKPNNPSVFPSLSISPITVGCPDNSITLTP